VLGLGGLQYFNIKISSTNLGSNRWFVMLLWSARVSLLWSLSGRPPVSGCVASGPRRGEEPHGLPRGVPHGLPHGVPYWLPHGLPQEATLSPPRPVPFPRYPHRWSVAAGASPHFSPAFSRGSIKKIWRQLSCFLLVASAMCRDNFPD
jgi:hypothetical protein